MTNYSQTIKNRGFSIVELMIAVFIGLIIILGLITVFDTTSRLNRTQNGLARLQENGRFAILQLKQNIEQVGFQYCSGSDLKSVGITESKNIFPFVVFTNALASGMPTRADVASTQTPPAGSAPSPYLVDPAYFIHGHECTGGSCSPTLSSLGSATAFTIPNVGTADGSRISGTDVLTFRYVSGPGRPIDDYSTNQATGAVTINLSAPVDPLNPPPEVASGAQVMLADCFNAPAIIALQSSSATVATANIAPGFNIRSSKSRSPRMFDFTNDVSSMTFYVANQVVDGRDIPTLFNVVNGVSNAIVQGVDRFDVIYGVQVNTGDVMLLDANGVENLPTASCMGSPSTDINGGISLSNTTGCGWRSVVSIEIHLLLNTIYNSTERTDEQFFYSLDGDTANVPADLAATINHYSMSRREFVALVTLKNF